MISPEFLAALPWVEISRSKAISRVAWVPLNDPASIVGSLYIEERKSKNIYRHESVRRSAAAVLIFGHSPGAMWNALQKEAPGEWVNDPRPCVGFDGVAQ